MRKIGIFGTIMICTIACTSCMSAMKIDNSVSEYQSKISSAEAKIEFIGFKADTALLSTTSSSAKIRSPLDQWKAIRDTAALKRIGKTLSDKNIAIDQSFAYFGIYSLQELELYKSQKRYVTFIEVVDNEYKYDISGDVRKKVFAGIGGGVLGGGAVLALSGIPLMTDKYYPTSSLTVTGGVFAGLGALLLIPAFIPEKTKTEFKGTYNIYLYDTQKKEIVYKDTATVSSVDTWKGSLSHGETDLNALHNYYGRKISNAILEKYDEVYHWLATK